MSTPGSSTSEAPRIHYLTPYAVDKNIGRAYNEAVEPIPAGDWVCVRDGDTIFLTPDWGRQIADIVARHGNTYSLIGCVTNRLRSTDQLYGNAFSDNHDMVNHGRIAHELRDTKYSDVRPYRQPVAGLFLLFPRSLWDIVKFKEKSITFDRQFGRDVMARGGRIGIAEGLYLYHWYRGWSVDPLNEVNHLR